MSQDSFAGPHTVEKLDKLEAYLKAFLTAFKNKPWAHTVYLDAFAGTGEIPKAGEPLTLPLEHHHAFVVGSARRALSLELKFKEYIFVEKSRKKSLELRQRLAKEHDEMEARVSIQNADANEAILQFCNRRDSNQRAVIFLDPFGSQVDWNSIAAIAATERADLWYLFPAGLSVHRQIGRNGTVHYTHEEPLNRLLGTTSWREAFIDEEEAAPDLFGLQEKRYIKTASPVSVTKFMIDRMGQVFKGGVLDSWLPLGSGNVHMYSLLFACANPSPNASKLALKLAKAVIGNRKHGRAK